MRSDKIHIIGIGDDGIQGLTEAARQIVQKAHLLIGEERALSQVPDSGADRLVLGDSYDIAVRRLSDLQNGTAVVLAQGDPLFYGVARYLCAQLGKERFDVEEYCISEGWIKVPAGKTLDRKGRPLLITLKGKVEAFYR